MGSPNARSWRVHGKDGRRFAGALVEKRGGGQVADGELFDQQGSGTQRERFEGKQVQRAIGDDEELGDGGAGGNAGEQELTDLRSLRAPRGIASRGQGGGQLADGSGVGGGQGSRDDSSCRPG